MTNIERPDSERPDIGRAPDCARCGNEIDNSKHSGTWLTADYWDCECEKDYIHPKTQDSCARCGMAEIKDCMPDSHVAEVAKYIARSLCADCQRAETEKRN